MLRRLYSTLPEAAAVARTASTPRAVRLRRLRKRPVPPGESDATAEGLTPTEHATYQRQLAKAELMGPDGHSTSPSEWVSRLNARRSRVRGTRILLAKGGIKEETVVGQKIYLPNIIFRLMRNHTPPGEPYNPYEATFRIPQNITKTDVRSYLSAVYGVRTTYIRTDNYFAPMMHWSRRDDSDRGRRVRKTYKRAVVGLVDPFYYPQAIEDMAKEEREARTEYLDNTFHIELMKAAQHDAKVRRALNEGVEVRVEDLPVKGRKKVVRKIAEERARKEALVVQTKEQMREAREKGEPFI